jgi:hypothetical protein
MPHRPSIAPALGLRAGIGGFFIVMQTASRKETPIMWFSSLRNRNRGGQINRRVTRPALEQLEDRLVPSNYTAGSVTQLIADINAANQAGGMNTITLTAPTTTPYVLTAVDNTTNGANGLPVIAKKDQLTIIGNGDTIERSSVSGTPAFRLFDVAAKGSLTLENLTVQGGLAFGSGSAAEGGAIFNQGTLDLNGVTVQNNIAQGQNGVNGIVINGQITATAGSSAAGGGVYSSGSLTLEGSTSVMNNQALGGRGGYAEGRGHFGGLVQLWVTNRGVGAAEQARTP